MGIIEAFFGLLFGAVLGAYGLIFMGVALTVLIGGGILTVTHILPSFALYAKRSWDNDDMPLKQLFNEIKPPPSKFVLTGGTDSKASDSTVDDYIEVEGKYQKVPTPQPVRPPGSNLRNR